MKALLLTLGILLASVNANAKTNDIRLNYSQVATSPTGATVSIYVLADGAVERSSFIRASKMLPTVEKVAQLGEEEMENINSLIEEARDARIFTLPQHAMCFVAPFSIPEASADNGKVFLSSGGACTVKKVNSSEAGRELTLFIQNLFAQFGHK